MDNYAFLRKYEELQSGIMSDKFIELDFGRITYCSGDTSSFWNHATINQIISPKELEIIENNLRKLKRKSAFYFENRSDLQELIIFLKNHEYQFIAEDSWMFHDGTNIDTSRFDQVKKVSNNQELDVFISTFNSCFQKGDPQNPYGELGEYLDVAKNAWHKHHSTNKIEYLTIFDNNKPVAVSTLTNHDGLGYLSNIGSLKKVRGKGFGKLATHYSVWKSIQNGNSQHFLATEEGDYPNEFYKRIGFKVRFTSPIYSKNTLDT